MFEDIEFSTEDFSEEEEYETVEELDEFDEDSSSEEGTIGAGSVYASSRGVLDNSEEEYEEIEDYDYFKN